MTRRVAITGIGAVTPARGRRADPCTSAGPPASPGSRTASAAARTSSRPTTSPAARCAAPTVSPSSRWSAAARGDLPGRAGRGALRPRRDRLRDRHRHRRALDDRVGAHHPARSRTARRLAALRAADDGQLRGRAPWRSSTTFAASASAPSRPAPPAPTRSAPRPGWSQHGDAIACVAGGTEAAITTWRWPPSPRWAPPRRSGISRPFDRRRDGFVMGEGAGVMVLEDAETAELRGAPILGYLTGYGATADAHHMTAPEPSGDGAARAIRKALADAEIEPGQLAYVNAHGTSTPLNDRSETEALKTALGEQACAGPDLLDQVRRSGTCSARPGPWRRVATLQALRAKTAPPTLNLEEPDEDLDLDYVPGRGQGAARERSPGRSGSATPSASAATTSCSASRRPREPDARRDARRRQRERLTPLGRLEALCDPGSLELRAHADRVALGPLGPGRRRRRRRGDRRRAPGLLLRAGPELRRRLAGHRPGRDDRPGARAGRPGLRAGGRLHRLGRRPDRRGRRRARRLRRDLPPARRALGPRAADQRDHRDLGGWRCLLAGAHRLRGDDRGVSALPDRPRRGRGGDGGERHAWTSSAAPASTPGTGSATWSPTTTAPPPSWSATCSATCRRARRSRPTAILPEEPLGA